MISSRFNHEIELVPGKILPIVEEMTDFYIEQVAAKINMPINKKQLKDRAIESYETNGQQNESSN